MHANAEVIARFYSAFQQRDAAAMGHCYHREVEFSDPVFTHLVGDRARGMWAMLCERGKDLRVEFSRVAADEQRGRAHWEAWYTFTGTGRQAHNVIEAQFEFRDGLIARHRDSFSLRRWAAQALGIKGVLLGWAPPIQNAIRAKAMQGLEQYLQRRSAAG